MACPTETVVVCFSEGKLNASLHSDVEDHIAECELCRIAVGAIAQGSATGSGSRWHTASTVANTDIPIGTIIDGRYRVDQRIGIGGMGVVYEAFHQTLRRKVAVKFISNSQVPNQISSRFAREAAVLAKLNCEFVVRVFDVGQSPEFGEYVVMELLEGHDLSEEIDNGLLPTAQVIDWILQACVALAHAHAAGIVHRDIKPSNLFLCKDARGTKLKILDFGLSKTIATGSQPDLGLTASGAILGSPLYMPPEQALDASSVDHRADIWGLGAVLHHLLTSKAPFPSNTLVELIAKISSDQPVPSLCPHVSPALDIVVRTCLAKKPQARWQSIAELANALVSFAGPRGPELLAQINALGSRGNAIETQLQTAPTRSRNKRMLGGLAIILATGVTAWMLLPPDQPTMALRTQSEMTLNGRFDIFQLPDVPASIDSATETGTPKTAKTAPLKISPKIKKGLRSTSKDPAPPEIVQQELTVLPAATTSDTVPLVDPKADRK
jgi:serine/threonine protein kinase